VGEQHSDKDDDAKHMIYTHKDLVIKYNNDQVFYCEFNELSFCRVFEGR
jgi:transmembrane 9 superfamily protein 3